MKDRLFSLAHHALKPLAFHLGFVPVYEAVEMLSQQNQAINDAGACLVEIKRIIQSVDTLKGVNIDGYEIEALRNLVRDHEELEARIEAVLLMLSHGDTDIERMGQVLCGAKRIPDTAEGLIGD